MKKFSALIIEDEKPARDLVEQYLSDFERVEIKGQYDNGFTGLKAINDMKPDVVFLDVQMPKLTGFEMLELLEFKPEIIFTTAYDQYAIKAFEQNAVDYLLKPFSKERFSEAMNKLLERLDKGQGSGDRLEQIKKSLTDSDETLQRIVVKKSGRIHVIAAENITYLEAQDDYVMIYTRNERFLKQQTMKYYERHLDEGLFIRVHRSYIVNIQLIDRLEPYEKNNYILSLKDGSKVSVSRAGMQRLREKLDF